MWEARIVLPHLTQSGDRLDPRIEHRFIEWITDSFGGCTTTQGFGYWRNPADGKLFREAVTVVDIAMDDTIDNNLRLEDIGASFKEAADQVCVYLRFPDGRVVVQ